MDNPPSEDSQIQDSGTFRHPELVSKSDLVSESQKTKQSFKFQFRKLYLLIFLLILLAGLTLINISISPFTQKPKLQQTTLQSSPTIIHATSPVPTGIGANWKKYTDTEYGFEVKYPREMEVKKSKSKIETEDSALIRFSTPEQSDRRKRIEVRVNINSLPYRSLEEYVNKIAYGPDIFLISAEDVTLGGVAAKKLVMKTDVANQEPSTSFYILYKERFYSWSGTDKNTFDQILSTFKFLD